MLELLLGLGLGKAVLNRYTENGAEQVKEVGKQSRILSGESDLICP